ncbi:MAG: hypothetical protein KDD69_18580, partial [Bdellovibrionales bacterium]|nr:hypothetical protein [Bdellovibrionales bacterium]
VSISDGGRADFAAHAHFGPDRVGMARFVPQIVTVGAAPDFYGTLTRYFYDCPGASCNDFLTAFVLPNRPPTGAAIAGGMATKNGEISIVELGNVSSTSVAAQVRAFNSNGSLAGVTVADVPALGTKHVIMNRVGETGYFANESVGSAEATVQNGLVSAVSLFYKLNDFGVLQYGYAAPFVSSPGGAQLTEFNSFVSHENEVEVFNSRSQTGSARLEIINLDQSLIGAQDIVVPAHGTVRLPLVVPKDTYGTLVLSGRDGLVMRSYVSRPGTYVLSYGGK